MVLRITYLLFLVPIIFSCNSKNTSEKVADTNGVNVKHSGKEIYSNYCVSCHGTDGKLGVSGAKDLSVSSLSDEMRLEIITNGKNAMPPMKDLIQSKEDILIVAEYTKSLKK